MTGICTQRFLVQQQCLAPPEHAHAHAPTHLRARPDKRDAVHAGHDGLLDELAVDLSVGQQGGGLGHAPRRVLRHRALDHVGDLGVHVLQAVQVQAVQVQAVQVSGADIRGGGTCAGACGGLCCLHGTG